MAPSTVTSSAGPSTSYTLSPLAYLKLVLHASKYTSCSVCGLLVGSTSSSSAATTINDLIPLLHQWTALSPMMEAALQMADLHLQSTGNDTPLVGLYLANSRLSDLSIPPTLQLVADKLRSRFSSAVVLVVDNERLDSTTQVPLLAYTYSASSKSYVPLPTSSSLTLSDPSILSATLARVEKGDSTLVGDFDDHLADPSVDWLTNSRVTL
ncbi:BQ2448_385 [Microbotryum intermedium]|uniref:BQ2448_385 protein n=1 Tax=Microbotryum intermedium TaxID=269621 RepID=A0A238F8Q6_9BASI|nr:BQ2448_385 [Microbotryum intermedium]